MDDMKIIQELQEQSTERQVLLDGYASFHSKEVQEIMGRQPAWILRWGVTIIILILVGIMVGCWFINFPQTVTATITLTSDNPPSDLATKVTGILDSVYVSGGDTVKAGQLLALIASTACYEDIIAAECYLLHRRDGGKKAEFPNSHKSLRLGDIQQYWTDYMAVRSDYEDYFELDQIGKKQKLLAGQVWRAKEYYRRLEDQRRTITEDLEYERKNLKRDSLLFSRKAISQSEYEKSLQSYISRKNTLAGFDATMANAHLSRLQLEQQILELNTQESSETAEYERKLAQSANILLGQIALWKEQYTISAPFEGIVSLQNVWGKGQRVSTGDIIASVAPVGEMKVIGRLKVPSSGFGKVKEGQEVNIKLNGFPYLEFGILKGIVQSISSVPENTQGGLAYTVDVALPTGLESSYHKTFPFVQNMDGSAEIITEDIRLIEQFVQPIRSLFVNR